MRRIKYKKTRKIDPNTFEYTGIYVNEPTEMQLFVYDDFGYEQYKKVSIERIGAEIADERQKDDVIWINLHGLHDTNNVQKLGSLLHLDSYIISDILNTTRRSKMEELENILFFSIKSILPSDNFEVLDVAQISFILKDNLLVSFQEKKCSFFDHIRDRIKTHSGIVRKKSNDYLLYLLLEAIIENFYVTIEHFEDQIDVLTNEAKSSDNQSILERIEKNRDTLNFIKKSIIPFREALFNLKSIRDDHDFDGIETANYSFFERLYQKSLEIIEQIDYDISSLDSASNFYFAAQTHKMNEVMRILTAVSVIFMPLTFIVGIYGMNFDVMPELRWKYGYLSVMLGMFILVGAMVFYFKNKKWF